MQLMYVERCSFYFFFLCSVTFLDKNIYIYTYYKTFLPVKYIPVVIRADRMAAGDQLGWADLIRATTPETWGHDMDVPDWKFHFTDRPSDGNRVGGVLGGHAANTPIPGAVMSGCT